YAFNWVRREVRRKVRAGVTAAVYCRDLSPQLQRGKSNARKLDADAEEDPKCTDGPWYRSRVSRGFLFGWREGLRNSELPVLRNAECIDEQPVGAAQVVQIL